MIKGGSAGFRTITALPRSAPPTTSIARAVVSVNSSMFARVPGPADFEAIEATISAYHTFATRLTAATMGTVACPPQVTMLIFNESRCCIEDQADRGKFRHRYQSLDPPSRRWHTEARCTLQSGRLGIDPDEGAIS